MKELKSCPFCGNEDIEIEYYVEGYIIFRIRCDVEMNILGDECASHRQDAIDQWNTRTESRRKA